MKIYFAGCIGYHRSYLLLERERNRLFSYYDLISENRSFTIVKEFEIVLEYNAKNK